METDPEVTSALRIAALKKRASTPEGRAEILAEIQSRETPTSDMPRAQRRKQQREQAKQSRRLNAILAAARQAGAKIV